MLSFSAQLTTQEVAICWHMLAFYIQPSPPFIRAMALCQCRAERVACSADTLDKSRHKPRQETQLPNPRSISLGNPRLPKCTVPLLSLNLASNSDFKVQSAGYNSAQSPTNWESIRGKDPSILCRLSSRLSIAPDDKIKMWNPRLYMSCKIHTITISSGPRPMQNGLKYEMFQTDFDVCVNFRCNRWCHYKMVSYLHA